MRSLLKVESTISLRILISELEYYLNLFPHFHQPPEIIIICIIFFAFVNLPLSVILSALRNLTPSLIYISHKLPQRYHIFLISKFHPNTHRKVRAYFNYENN